MNKEEFLKSNYFKILLPVIILWGVIVIAKGGYAFGQWLYAFLH